jgi:hypothetical protein
MYTPKIPPQSSEELLPYLDDELVKISQEINNLSAGQYQVLYKSPAKVKPGLVVYADGTDWDPGSGEGLYRYNLAGSWVFIG